jgi:hypothetical protein
LTLPKERFKEEKMLGFPSIPVGSGNDFMTNKPPLLNITMILHEQGTLE